MRLVFSLSTLLLLSQIITHATWGSDKNVLAEDDIRATEVLAPDGVPWELTQQPERVVAISDIHGDLNALLTLLADRGLVSPKGEWTGGTTHLVIIGDVNDRGKDTRLIYDLLMRLEIEALEAGGAVHTLLGNHDAMTARGPAYETSAEEMMLFAATPNATKQEALSDYRKAMSGESKYARWVRQRNTILKIGDNLFVHGGLKSEWVFKHRPAEINATVRAWLAFQQGVGPRPPIKTAWVLGGNGPLWTLDLSHGRLNPDLFQIMLKKWGVRRAIVGHDITSGMLIQSPLRYKGSLWKIDTAMSASTRPNGNPSALEIQGKQITMHHIPRPKKAHPYYKEAWLNAWKPIDIVINPNDVLWRAVPKNYMPSQGEKILEFHGYHWVLTKEAVPFLRALSKLPNARITFYSDALPEREIALLKQIKLPGGLDGVSLAERRVYSDVHLLSPQLYGNRRKDLRLLGKHIDLERAVLIDSNPDAAERTQEESFLHVSDKGGNQELMKAMGIIETAYEHSAHGDLTFSQGIAKAAADAKATPDTYRDRGSMQFLALDPSECQKPGIFKRIIARIKLTKALK